MVDEDMALSRVMLTDAGEEHMELVRILECEKVLTIDISPDCQRFLERITVLFERQGCLGCGRTAFMLRVLEQERLLWIDRRPKRVGGLCSSQ